jgi:predicted transcriptional regulator
LLDDNTARYIIEQAGNIPYYIQLLAAEIWQDMIATHKFRLSATSTTQKALSGLVESGIVEKAEGNYFIGDPFFKRFLLRYA